MESQEIRQLRGSRTRADFAADLGVNAHTVYRWELPDTSAHARKPRGDVLARLERLAQRTTQSKGTVSVIAALQRMLDGAWADSEDVFLEVLSDREVTSEARSIASLGLALVELLFRGDVRRAFTALTPALAREAPELALVEAVAALVHSYPDRQLFDLGQVHAHARRAETLDRRESSLVRALVTTAEANAAICAGIDELLGHALARIDSITNVTLPRIPAMFLESYRSMRASLSGQQELGLQILDRLIADPVLVTCPTLESRVFAIRALRMLENLGDPEEALALARRSREVAAQHRLVSGVHSALGLRAEAEALLRLCRLDEAALVFVESDRFFATLGFPVTIVFPAQARYLLAIGATDALDALAARVLAVEIPSMRPACQVYGAWLAASAELSRDVDPERTLRAYARAEQLASGFSLIERDLLATYASAALVYGTSAHARDVLHRAQRVADRRPAAWVTASLRRVEGTLMIEEGRLAEGRTMIEAAASTFEAAGDRMDAVLARYANAAIERALGTAGAGPRADVALAELQSLGLARATWLERLDGRVRSAVAESTRRSAGQVLGPHGASDTLGAELEVWLRRLSVAGATPAMMRRELLAVAEQICGTRVSLVDADGTSRIAAAEWFDVDAGNGQRLRLGVSAPPTAAARAALRVIALVGGLAMEVAGLRAGVRTPSSPPEMIRELPGVIAASPAMLGLLSDVGRLASSRATVVITGESGTGKEVIAHALHAASTRATRPFVAFNCAAVPHDLFEGQLFGYRKGAFTGAVGDHPGVVRAADGGTLFLDEIGELPLDIQPKLLRFLDSREVFPLGAQRPVIADVRVVAATNRDLADEVARGRFREDLFYRLQVVPLHVPPLRARREDIVPLARHFVRELATANRVPAFAPDALAALTAHPWPGNVRELRNVIARAMAYEPTPDVLTRAGLGL